MVCSIRLTMTKRLRLSRTSFFLSPSKRWFISRHCTSEYIYGIAYKRISFSSRKWFRLSSFLARCLFIFDLKRRIETMLEFFFWNITELPSDIFIRFPYSSVPVRTKTKHMDVKTVLQTSVWNFRLAEDLRADLNVLYGVDLEKDAGSGSVYRAHFYLLQTLITDCQGFFFSFFLSKKRSEMTYWQHYSSLSITDFSKRQWRLKAPFILFFLICAEFHNWGPSSPNPSPTLFLLSSRARIDLPALLIFFLYLTRRGRWIIWRLFPNLCTLRRSLSNCHELHWCDSFHELDAHKQIAGEIRIISIPYLVLIQEIWRPRRGHMSF